MANENFDTEEKEEAKAKPSEEEKAEEAERPEAAEEGEMPDDAKAGENPDGSDDGADGSGDGDDENGGEEDGAEKASAKKDKKDSLIEDLNDRLKRQMAEFENFRKRTEKEKTQMFDMGAKNIIEKILPTVDNFERGLASAPEEEGQDGFADGMRMVYKQLTTSLEEAGLTPIEAVGCEFNPEYHNAVMHIDDDAYGENEIVEELQKGYMYHDTVVRHSMVKVAN